VPPAVLRMAGDASGQYRTAYRTGVVGASDRKRHNI